jgi:tetratricopeptide (TPR) repeat protein
LAKVEQQLLGLESDSPAHWQALMEKSVLQFQLGQYDQALKGFTSVSKDETHHYDSLRYLAILQARAGEAEEARALLKEFLAGTSAAMRESYGSYLTMIVESWLGNGETALNRLETEVASHGASGLFLYNAACACSLSTLAASHHDQPELASRLKGLGLRLLGESLSLGQNISQLSGDADLDPLRDEQEFTGLLSPRGSEEAKWRSVASSNGYRLPTEAEWEYACRAGTTTTFSCGDDESLLNHYAVFSSSRTELVGSKLPNGWGLFDVHGNVFEWCQDWYGDYPHGSVTDPPGAASSYGRTVRGGSWQSNADMCHSAYRHGSSPGSRYKFLGCRVARTYR